MAKLGTIRFGSPWMGQNDLRNIDANPGLCVAQENCWMERQDLLQRRPSLTRYHTSDSGSITAKPVLPAPNGLVRFDETYYGSRLFYVTEDITGGLKVVSHNPLAHRVGVNFNTYGSKASTAQLIGSQMFLVQCTPFLHFTSGNPTSSGYAYGPQLMDTSVKSVRSIQLHNSWYSPSGKLVPGCTYNVRYRLELRDDNGIPRAMSEWSIPITQTVDSGHTLIYIGTYYYASSTYGIATNYMPDGWGDTFNWNMPTIGGWKYYLVIARTLAGVGIDGPYYYDSEKAVSSFEGGSVIGHSAGLKSDSELSDEIDEWVGLDYATDVVAINGVYAWLKIGLLYWGTAEYPYLAYTTNFVPVNGSSIVPLDSSTLAVIGKRTIQYIRGLPDTPIVEEYPFDGTSNKGAFFISGGSIKMKSMEGFIYDITTRQRVSEHIPWLTEITASDESLDAVSEPSTTVTVIKCNNTTVGQPGGIKQPNISIAVRNEDEAIWRLPDNCLGSSSHFSDTRKTDKRYAGTAKLWKAVMNGSNFEVWTNPLNAADSLNDVAGETSTPIKAYWQSSWQSAGVPGQKGIKSIRVKQESGSACSVVIEVTDNPGKDPSAGDSLIFDNPFQEHAVNLTGKFFRITINSMDGAYWNINYVEVDYAVDGSK